MKKRLILWATSLLLALSPFAVATVLNPLPFTLTNNTTADATQVMANFNQIVSNCNANCAHSGANSDITSISALSTPLSAGQGGTGVASLTANNVLLGNGASAVQFVAPGTAGNILTSTGGTWSSIAAPATGVLSINDGTHGGLFFGPASTGNVSGIFFPSDLVTKSQTLLSDFMVIADSSASQQGKLTSLTNVLNTRSLVIVADRKTNGTAGQGLTVNTYVDRNLNTEILDTGGIASVSTPNVQLQAGTYDVRADITAAATGNGNFLTRLFNTSTGLVQADTNGNNCISTNLHVAGTTGSMQLRCRFTISGTQSLKFQTWTDSGAATGGEAHNVNGGTGSAEQENYLTAEFTFVAP